jgi:hypothetical protein
MIKARTCAVLIPKQPQICRIILNNERKAAKLNNRVALQFFPDKSASHLLTPQNEKKTIIKK